MPTPQCCTFTKKSGKNGKFLPLFFSRKLFYHFFLRFYLPLFFEANATLFFCQCDWPVWPVRTDKRRGAAGKKVRGHNSHGAHARSANAPKRSITAFAAPKNVRVLEDLPTGQCDWPVWPETDNEKKIPDPSQRIAISQIITLAKI